MTKVKPRGAETNLTRLVNRAKNGERIVIQKTTSHWWSEFLIGLQGPDILASYANSS